MICVIPTDPGLHRRPVAAADLRSTRRSISAPCAISLPTPSSPRWRRSTGFRPALPVSAIQWTNPYAQRVILIVASHAEPQFRNCDHGRSSVLGRRPFRGPLGVPAHARRASALHGAAALPPLQRRPDGQRGHHGSPRSVSLVRARRGLRDLEHPLRGRPGRWRARHPRQHLTGARPGQPRTAAAWTESDSAITNGVGCPSANPHTAAVDGGHPRPARHGEIDPGLHAPATGTPPSTTPSRPVDIPRRESDAQRQPARIRSGRRPPEALVRTSGNPCRCPSTCSTRPASSRRSAAWRRGRSPNARGSAATDDDDHHDLQRHPRPIRDRLGAVLAGRHHQVGTARHRGRCRVVRAMGESLHAGPSCWPTARANCR